MPRAACCHNLKRQEAHESNTAHSEHQNERPLQTWKDIAGYLERDVRTAMRWEKENGLPVRRHGEGKGSSVYAYPSEIEAWRAGREFARTEAEAVPAASRSWIWGAVAAAAIVALLLAGPIFNPPNPLADAAARSGSMIARQVWTGDGGDRVDDSGGVSPDGKQLAYVDWEKGALKVRNLASEETRTLIEGDNYTTGNPAAAVYRPDDRAIAYVWEDCTEGQNDWEIRLPVTLPPGFVTPPTPAFMPPLPTGPGSSQHSSVVFS